MYQTDIKFNKSLRKMYNSKLVNKQFSGTTEYG